MNTRTQSFLLLLFGGVLIHLATGDALLNYVRPVARPWVLIAGAAIVIVSVVQLVLSSKLTETDVGSRNGWLILMPVLVLLLIAPPALGAFTARRDPVTVAAPPHPDTPFPALTGPSPHQLKLGDFVLRVLWDSARTVTGQNVAIDGFVVEQRPDGFILARLVITCCAADARPLEVLIRSSVHPQPDSWVDVTGSYSGLDPATSELPTLAAGHVTAIPTPANPYD